MKLSSDQLQFLARLNRSPDGAFLLTVLRAWLAERDEAMSEARGEDVFRAQGRSKELRSIISEITKAHEQLARNQPASSRPRMEA